MQAHYTTGSSSFATTFFLLYTASRCFLFHQVISRPVKAKSEAEQKKNTKTLEFRRMKTTSQ